MYQKNQINSLDYHIEGLKYNKEVNRHEREREENPGASSLSSDGDREGEAGVIFEGNFPEFMENINTQIQKF